VNETGLDSAATDLPPESQRELKGLNWGALVFTPLWLFRNGFLVSFAVYLVCGYLSMWLPLAMSTLFFFKGTQWSWGNGNRWKSYDQFADSQAVWNLVAKPCFLIMAGCLLFLFSKELGFFT
jgi:hypothetical protein